MKYTKDYCIVNYSDGIFIKGQERIKTSFQSVGYTGDFLFFSDSTMFPPHNESPWGFKPLAIRKAFEKGYKYVLWLDSSMMAIRNPISVFKKIVRDGYYFNTQKGDSAGEWCTDYALEELNISRKESFSIEMLNANIAGFSSGSDAAMLILDEWCNFAKRKKAFRGLPDSFELAQTFNNNFLQCSSDQRVKGHRHDQTVLSILVGINKAKTYHKEVKNIQYNSEDGVCRYARAIPLTVCIVTNRDIKNEIYLQTYNKWGNTRGFSKLVFILFSLVSTLREIVQELQ